MNARQQPDSLELSKARETLSSKQCDVDIADAYVPDTITPCEESKVGTFGELLRKVLPVLDRPAASRQREGQSRRRSFTDELPWVKYLPDDGQFALDDGVSKMACYDLVPVATEGRSVSILRRIVQDLMPILHGLIPEHDQNPWVMGIYGYFDQSIDDALEVMEEYQHPRARGSAYSVDYMRRMREHYRDVSRAGGYFLDEVVSGSVWGGQTQRVHIVLFRKYARPRIPERDVDPIAELDDVCGRLENVLGSMGVKHLRMDGELFYNWMSARFNPRPAACDGDPKRLKEFAPYPGDDNLPYGSDLSEAMCLTPPVVDDKNGIWYFDGMPHVVLQTESIVNVPTPGALTGEIERHDKRNTTIDQLPEGTMMALNIIFTPSDKTVSGVESVRDASYGDSETARATRKEAANVLGHLEDTQEPMYPAELAFYIRAPTLVRLREVVADSETALKRAGIKVYKPFMARDPVRTGNFLRSLPGVLKPGIDQDATRRAKLMHANHIMRLAPMFGRGRGSGRPGMAMFNRSGEPLFHDLLSREENQLNGHTFIYGVSGSGKSAVTISMVDSALAMHRPRVVVIDLGGSFHPLAMHAKRMGLTTHVMQMNMQTRETMAPFADAMMLVGVQADPTAVKEEESIEEDMESFATGAKGLSAEERAKAERDVLGEQEIIARLMISGQSGKDVESATLKIAIRRAILDAVDRVARGEVKSSVPRPQDVADSLEAIANDKKNEDNRAAIIEMANAMRLFCSGLDDHLFNRDGKPWPEVDFTLVDLADAAKAGRSATLILTVVSLLTQVDRIAERDQHKGRPTLFIVEEGHTVTGQELLMWLLMKIVKMWRKFGAHLWLTTQEIEDVPPDVKRMIGMMENWVAMNLSAQDVELTRDFRPITDEQGSMMRQCRMSKRVFSEGTLLTYGGGVSQFRSVPPALTLALGMTAPEEKEQRARIMAETGMSEEEVFYQIEKEIKAQRLANAPGLMGKKRKKSKRRAA